MNVLLSMPVLATWYNPFTWLRDAARDMADAIMSVVSWLSDQLAAKCDAALDVLPKFPQIDWTPINSVIATVNAWVPVKVILTCVGLYLVWWLVWSLLRIVLKLIWSG